MRIAIIGSTQYYTIERRHSEKLLGAGHQVRLAATDSSGDDTITILRHNRELIQWADEVHVFWDQRSMGTVFDFGMAFALAKPLVVVYMEEKTLGDGMRQYENISHDLGDGWISTMGVSDEASGQ